MNYNKFFDDQNKFDTFKKNFDHIIYAWIKKEFKYE